MNECLFTAMDVVGFLWNLHRSRVACGGGVGGGLGRVVN